jgi:hypothetical protein
MVRMKFDLDSPRDCERFADTVAALQNSGVKFFVVRDSHSDGSYAKYAEVKFGEEV